MVVLALGKQPSEAARVTQFNSTIENQVVTLLQHPDLDCQSLLCTTAAQQNLSEQNLSDVHGPHLACATLALSAEVVSSS